jgi:hypothetical protein
MLKNVQALALATFVGAGALAALSVRADAANVPAPGVTKAFDTVANGDLYQEAQSRAERRNAWRYDRRSHGYRYNYPYRNYRYYYGGWYYDQPYWSFNFPLYYDYPVYNYRPAYRYRLSARHIDWCYARYRSYNARSNTWISYSGQVRQCISPWGP